MAHHTPRETTFRKRPGTTDIGKDYEDLTVARLVLQLLNNESYRTFKISSNDEKFGAFDDVIVEMEKEDESYVRYALQLKHSHLGKQLTVTSLLADKGEFSIKKYFESYHKCKKDTEGFKFVLYTNRKFFPDKPLFQFELNKDETFHFKVVPVESDVVINTSKMKQNCYKFEIVKDLVGIPFTEKNAEYEEFFSHFYLYSNQSNVTHLEKYIPEVMNCLFSCNQEMVDKYLKFIREWSKFEGEKDKLTKNMMRQRIALYLLGPFVYPIVFTSVMKNGKLLQEAISKFKVTVFSGEHVEKVQQLWGDVRNEKLDSKVINIIKRKYQITSERIDDISKLSDEDCTHLLWLMNKCPLIVTENDQAYEAIKLCDFKQFVLIGQNEERKISEEVRIFENLSHLNCYEDVWKSIIENFKCSVAEKEVTLEDLIEGNNKLEETITTNVLLEMVEGPYQIGMQQEEVLPAPYINRSVCNQLVDVKYLHSIDNNTLIVISNFTKESWNRFRMFEIIPIDDYLYGESSESPLEVCKKKKIYVSENVCTESTFLKICEKNKARNKCHHFKVYDTLLEWVKSTNSVVDVKKYIVNEQSKCGEDNLHLLNLENHLNIIADNSGSGKSWLMKRFKNNISERNLTLLLSPKDVFCICKSVGFGGVESCIINMKYPNCKKFDRDVIQWMMDHGLVTLIWDGLDEVVSKENSEFVIKCVRYFEDKGCFQWLTCRPNLKNYLENKFNVLSKTISEFSEDEQIGYIQNRLKLKYPEESLIDVARKIRNNIVLPKGKDILSIPIQTFMLTEIYLSDPKKYDFFLHGPFPVTHLYRYFIEEKFNFCFSEEFRGDSQFERAKKKMHTQAYLKHYQLKSLKFLLGPELLEDMEIDFSDYSDEGEEYDCFDFVQRNQFVHISYVEYFVATYFAKQVKRKKPRSRIVRVLSKHIFSVALTNVRFFFDMLLAEESPAHLAVLDGSFERLKTFGDDLVLKKDSGGRNALQIACSWGQRQPILNVEETEADRFYLEENFDLVLRKDNCEYVNMVRLLLEKCDSSEANDIFKLDSLSYAEKCECFCVLAIIEEKQKSGYFDAADVSFQCSALYYSVRFAYDFVIDFFRNVRYVETGFGNLLLVAVEYNAVECVKKLLSVEKYARMVNYGVNGLTPLFLACTSGNLKMTSLLQDAGASITQFKSDSDGDVDNPLEMSTLVKKNVWTPLHVATFYGYHEIIEQLLLKRNSVDEYQKDLDIDAPDKENWSALHIACQNGFKKIAELLIKSGADVDALTQKGSTPLFLASQNGHDDVVDFLIESGADVNAVNATGHTALLMSSNYGHYDVSESLIESGADVNAADKNKWTALHLASQNGYEKVVELLIKSGGEIDVKEKYEMTALHMACQNGHHQVAKLLIESGFDVNSVGKDDCTPLYLSSQNGHYAVAKLLIESGANVNVVQMFNWTPLHIASQKGYDSLVELLIRSGAEVNAVDTDNCTALYIASSCNQANVVELLIQSGADVNAVDNHNFTALHIASQMGNDKIAELLIQSGAHISTVNTDNCTPLNVASYNGHYNIAGMLIEAGADINAVDICGCTALHAACEKGYDGIVAALVKSGADVNAVDIDNATPLLIASQYGHYQVVALLIKSGAVNDNNYYKSLYMATQQGNCDVVELLISSGVAVNAVKIDSWTLLHVASQQGHDTVVNLLIQSGADVNAVVDDNYTALYMACQNGYDKVAKLLIQSGADVNAVASNNSTALYIACHNGHDKVVQLLLESQADVNVAGVDACTPLFIGSLNGHYKVVELLLKSGANVNVVDNYDFTALHVASQKGYDEIVDLLIKAGACVNAVGDADCTALHMASHTGREKVVELLIQSGADVNAVNVDKCSALYLASGKGHDAVVELLIKLGADVNVGDRDNRTALCMATNKGHSKIVQLLIASGAKLEYSN